MKYTFIIPYRNRNEHLQEFIRRFSQFLQNTDVDAQFYVVHQLHPGEFNRGALCNIGFLECSKIRPDGLFVFHDVDTYPTYWGSIQYDTPKGMVRHALGLPHENLGGVCCFWKEDFERVNGFPNYWGWGIEDVTLRCRVHDARIPIDETNIVDLNDITKCEMPSHKRNLKKEEQSATRNTELHHQERRSGDIRNGIQTLEYQVISTLEIAPRFTVLNVNFQLQVEKK